MQKVSLIDSSSSLRPTIEEILSAVRLLTIATISDDALPHVNTCYFAFDDTLSLFVLTPPSARHSRYGLKSGSCAVNIADTNHKVGDPIAGLQLNCDFSMAERNDVERAYGIYSKRHTKFAEFVPNLDHLAKNLSSRFFILRIKSGQIIHELSLGSENYVQFEVVR